MKNLVFSLSTYKTEYFHCRIFHFSYICIAKSKKKKRMSPFLKEGHLFLNTKTQLL